MVLGSLSRSIPQTSTLPDVLLERPDKILINELFPAPLGPKSPKILPRSIFKSMLSNASESLFPYFFVRPLTSII